MPSRDHQNPISQDKPPGGQPGGSASPGARQQQAGSELGLGQTQEAAARGRQGAAGGDPNSRTGELDSQYGGYGPGDEGFGRPAGSSSAAQAQDAQGHGGYQNKERYGGYASEQRAGHNDPAGPGQAGTGTDPDLKIDAERISRATAEVSVKSQSADPAGYEAVDAGPDRESGTATTPGGQRHPGG